MGRHGLWRDTRTDHTHRLFNRLTADLEEVLADFKESGIYGRVGRDGVEALLCRYYLNAEVFTGTPMYDKCWDHARNIIARHQGGGFRHRSCQRLSGPLLRQQ